MTDLGTTSSYTELTKEDTKELAVAVTNWVSLSRKWGVILDGSNHMTNDEKWFNKKMDRREFQKQD